MNRSSKLLDSFIRVSSVLIRVSFINRRIAVALLLGGSVFLCGCSRSTAELKLSGKTMGTFYEITLAASEEFPQPDELQRDVEALLSQINQQMSTYLKESEISRFNASDSLEWFSISTEFAKVVSEALEVSKQTDACFDPTVGPLVNLWHFGPDLSTQKIPDDAIIKQTMQVVGYEKLHVRLRPPAIRKEKAGLKIDLSAIAKGYAVDRVGGLLSEKGYQNYLVNIGGEVVAHGKKNDQTSWRLGIEKPVENQREVTQIVALTNSAMATSGDYRNFYKIDGQKFSHTIDAKTGRPVTHSLHSVSVITETCMQADALATALMVMGPTRAWEYAEKHQLNVYLIYEQDGKLVTKYSSRFPLLDTKE